MKKSIAVVVMMMVLTPIFAEWRHSETEDMMAGTVSRVMMKKASAAEGTLNTPYLIVKHNGEKYSLYIAWGGYHMEYDPPKILAKFGDDVSSWKITPSTNKEASFIGNTWGFIDLLIAHDEVVLQQDRATGVKSVARWDVSDFEDALKILNPEEGLK